MVPMQRVLKYHLLLQVHKEGKAWASRGTQISLQGLLGAGLPSLGGYHRGSAPASRDSRGRKKELVGQACLEGPPGGGGRPRQHASLWVTQELVKHTQDAMEKDNLRLALDAMRVSGPTQGRRCHTDTHGFKSGSTTQARPHPRAAPSLHTYTSNDLFPASPLGTVTFSCCPLAGNGGSTSIPCQVGDKAGGGGTQAHPCPTPRTWHSA